MRAGVRGPPHKNRASQFSDPQKHATPLPLPPPPPPRDSAVHLRCRLESGSAWVSKGAAGPHAAQVTPSWPGTAGLARKLRAHAGHLRPAPKSTAGRGATRVCCSRVVLPTTFLSGSSPSRPRRTSSVLLQPSRTTTAPHPPPTPRTAQCTEADAAGHQKVAETTPA